MYEICYVIPTFNRFEQIKRTIAQLINVNEQCGVNYSIFLMDNSTVTDTHNFFSNFIHPRLTYKKREKTISNGNLSLHTVLTEVEILADWYWWMGDDDYVLLEGLMRVKQLLTKTDVSYIHASDVTNIPVKEEVKDIFQNLVTDIGLLDITSFMTSQLFRRVILERIVGYINNTKSNWDFNFNQSLFLSRALWSENGVVVNVGVVVAQNKIHFENESVNHDASKFYDSIKGWFNLAENLITLENYIGVKFPVKETFFYFQGKPIWYSFFKWIIKHNQFARNNIPQEDYLRIKNLIFLSHLQNEKAIQILELIDAATQLKSNYVDQNDAEILDMVKMLF